MLCLFCVVPFLCGGVVWFPHCTDQIPPDSMESRDSSALLLPLCFVLGMGQFLSQFIAMFENNSVVVCGRTI